MVRTRFGVATALLLVLLTAPARAQTLPEALAQALHDNPQLQAARAALRAVEQNVPLALANWRPVVTVNAEQGVSHTADREDCGKAPAQLFVGVDCSYKALNTMSNLWPQSYGLTVTEPLYRGGRTVAQTRQALNQVRAQHANLVASEADLLLGVATDYLDLLEARAAVDLAVNNQQVMRRQLVGAQSRYRIGELTRTDVDQAGAAFSLAIADRTTAEVQARVAAAAYEHDVGAAPGTLAPPIGPADLPVVRDEAATIAALANPSVIQAQFAEAASEAAVDLAGGQALPQLNLQAAVSRAKEITQSGLRSDNGQVVVQLAVPLYQGGAVRALVRQAEATVAEARSLIDDARHTAVQSARQAWDQREGARAMIAIFLGQIRENESALVGVQQQAALGDRTVLDILNQEQALYQSRLSLVQAQRDELVAAFTLAHALGRLTGTNLALPIAAAAADPALTH